MKRLCTLIFLLVCFLSPVSAKETLVYSTHPDYAPMSWFENNKFVGVAPTLLETIFAEIGIPIRSQFYPWRRTLEAVRQGHIDVIANLYRTKEREEFLVYSDIYYSEEKIVLVTHKGHEFPFNNWEDLIDRKGGAILGDSWGGEFDSYIETHLNVELVHGNKQNFMKLLNDRIEYIVMTEKNIQIFSKRFNISDKISVLPVAVNTEKEYFAFSKKSAFIKYLPQFNTKLREMIENGEVKKLIEKYIEQASKAALD